MMRPSLLAAWAYLDASQMAKTMPGFAARIAAIVHRFSPASATLAAQFYREQRRAAGITAPFTPRPASPPPLEQIGKTISWATSDLWTVGTDAQAEPKPELVAVAQRRLEGAVDKLVLDVGRNTIIDNVAADRHAKAWARVPEPGACHFCAMLASRGAVYKDDSFKRSDPRFAGGDTSSTIKVHDHCRCQPEPVFTAYEPTAQIRQWQADWNRVTEGLSSADARLAWRQHYEGRKVTAKPGSASRSGKSGASLPTHNPAADVDAGRSVEELQQTLAALEHSLTKFDSPGTRKRVEELRRKIAQRS